MPFRGRFIAVALFLTGLISGIFFMPPARAGTLSCSVTAATACAGAVIWRMSGAANAHAELPGQTAAAYDNNVVCCAGVAGLGNLCSGTFATALKLSGATNAHVRQGTLADYPSAAKVCLSVPAGGNVLIGYRQNNCGGYDATLGSMSGTTNAHIGDGAAYLTKICATAALPNVLNIDIVDAGGVSVPNPSIAMGESFFSFFYQAANGVFGTSTQRIRVNNTTTNSKWSLTMAADSGPAAFWAGLAAGYDFNDPAANAVDGPDADNLGGQMAMNFSGAAITPQSGCDTNGLTLGSSAAYSEGVVDSITLLSAGASADKNCYWDVTNIAVSQTIPEEQPAASDYNINITLTITAI